jgi:hypothetical protein
MTGDLNPGCCACGSSPPPTTHCVQVQGCSVPPNTFFPTLSVGGSVVTPSATLSNETCWHADPATGTVGFGGGAGYSTPVVFTVGSTTAFVSNRISYTLTASTTCCNRVPSSTLTFSATDPYGGAGIAGWYSPTFTLGGPGCGVFTTPTAYLYLTCPGTFAPNAWQLFSQSLVLPFTLGNVDGPFNLGGGFPPFSFTFTDFGCPTITLNIT